MSNKNKGLYELEKLINARLAALPADKRPLSRDLGKTNGFRVQSVAVSARGYFEATLSHGHAESYSVEEAKALLS